MLDTYEFVSIYNDTVVVSATRDRDGGLGAGAAYIYTQNGSTWDEQKIVPNDVLPYQYFGTSLSILDDKVMISKLGDVYTYTQNGSAWDEQRIISDDSLALNRFGNSISTSDDTMVVGAPRYSLQPGSNDGAAYFYTWNGTNWDGEQMVLLDILGSRDFGSPVSISGDTAMIGTLRYDGLYPYTNNDTHWNRQGVILDNASRNSAFGHSVFISGDTAIVGAPLESSPRGAAYIYTWNGTNWNYDEKIVPSNRNTNTFVASVTISENVAVVGTGVPGRIQPSCVIESVHIFTRNGTTWDEHKIVSGIYGDGYDRFGSSVAISGDTLVIGAPGDNAVYVLSGDWSQYVVPVDDTICNLPPQPYSSNASPQDPGDDSDEETRVIQNMVAEISSTIYFDPYTMHLHFVDSTLSEIFLITDVQSTSDPEGQIKTLIYLSPSNITPLFDASPYVGQNMEFVITDIANGNLQTTHVASVTTYDDFKEKEKSAGEDPVTPNFDFLQ